MASELVSSVDPLPRMPTPEEVLERAGATNPAIVLPVQLQLAQDRAAWLGRLLAEQVEREGVAGVVGEELAVTRDGRTVATSEKLRGLFVAERDERQHVAVLAERIARLGLDHVQATTARNQDIAVWAIAAMRRMASELGFDPRSAEAMEAGRRTAEWIASERGALEVNRHEERRGARRA